MFVKKFARPFVKKFKDMFGFQKVLIREKLLKKVIFFMFSFTMKNKKKKVKYK